jgi:hypothetical protein
VVLADGIAYNTYSSAASVSDDNRLVQEGSTYKGGFYSKVLIRRLTTTPQEPTVVPSASPTRDAWTLDNATDDDWLIGISHNNESDGGSDGSRLSSHEDDAWKFGVKNSSLGIGNTTGGAVEAVQIAELPAQEAAATLLMRQDASASGVNIRHPSTAAATAVAASATLGASASMPPSSAGARNWTYTASAAAAICIVAFALVVAGNLRRRRMNVGAGVTSDDTAASTPTPSSPASDHTLSPLAAGASSLL